MDNRDKHTSGPFQSLARALGFTYGEAAFVAGLIVRQGSERGAELLMNPAALDELAKYASLPDSERSPQNRRGGNGPEPGFNCRCDIIPPLNE